MKGNFYNNPLKIIWYGKKAILPTYLWFLWITFTSILFIGLYYGYVDFSLFNIHNYLSPTVTGLSFTLALFIAVKNIFNMNELKQLAESKGNNDHFKGKALLELFTPFIFTAAVFLVLGIGCLVAPYISCTIGRYSELLKASYVSGFLLGIISLFNLLNMMFNDLYHKVYR